MDKQKPRRSNIFELVTLDSKKEASHYETLTKQTLNTNSERHYMSPVMNQRHPTTDYSDDSLHYQNIKMQSPKGNCMTPVTNSGELIDRNESSICCHEEKQENQHIISPMKEEKPFMSNLSKALIIAGLLAATFLIAFGGIVFAAVSFTNQMENQEETSKMFQELMEEMFQQAKNNSELISRVLSLESKLPQSISLLETELNETKNQLESLSSNVGQLMLMLNEKINMAVSNYTRLNVVTSNLETNFNSNQRRFNSFESTVTNNYTRLYERVNESTRPGNCMKEVRNCIISPVSRNESYWYACITPTLSFSRTVSCIHAIREYIWPYSCRRV